MENLKENLAEVREKIKIAAEKSGRQAEDITLVAVTKTVEPARIAQLLALGVTTLGENKAQELLSKYGLFTPEPEWHIIGHLQTNKVKSIIGKVKMIQSLDSLHLAAELDKRAKQIDKIIDVLIEVNVAKEYTKNGIDMDDIYSFIEHLSAYANVRLRGLMCMAPLVTNPDDNRIFYKKMLEKYLDIKKFLGHNGNITHLSMGTSQDLTEAILEGATVVRAGMSLFGARI